MTSLNTSNKLSRRNWLRDAAIAATSTAVLPSLLTSCTDHTLPPGVGEGTPGTVLLSAPELENAAQNLKRMEAFIADLYPYSIEYEVIVWAYLQSGEVPPKKWTDFAVDTLITIVSAMLAAMAAAADAPILGIIVGAVFAITTNFIRKWKSGSVPPKLNKVFGAFAEAHYAMQSALSDKLLLLAAPDDNYRNLRDEWEGELEFEGKKYTLKDLATSQFPTKDQGNQYVPMREAGKKRFKQYYWNMMIAKAGHLNSGTFYKQREEHYTPTEYARDEFYRDNKTAYLRGYYKDGYYYYSNWYFDFDGKLLTNEGVKELFIDDTPGHKINPAGLFNRDYVFKQFHTQKPDFSPYHELRKDFSVNNEDRGTSWWGFDGENKTDDFVFTGGLIKG